MYTLIKVNQKKPQFGPEVINSRILKAFEFGPQGTDSEMLSDWVLRN